MATALVKRGEETLVKAHGVYSNNTIYLASLKKGLHWRAMGYLIKVQKVDRPTNRSFYLNLPAVLAEALAVGKGEQWQWNVEDKNTLILTRLKPLRPRRLKHKP